MQIPETHYARVGDLRIAYQKWGQGPPLTIGPANTSNVEIAWEHELYRRTREHLGQHLTCVVFDKRGIGLSDRFDDAPTLEQRTEDILAVMDAVGWERTHFFGASEGAAMGRSIDDSASPESEALQVATKKVLSAHPVLGRMATSHTPPQWGQTAFRHLPRSGML